MKKITSLLFLVIASTLIFIACEKQTIDLGSGTLVVPGDSVRFSTVIIPLLAANCTSCHNTGGQTPNMEASVAYTNLINGGYVNIAAPASSLIYVKITSTSHGGGQFAANITDPIFQWISQGAKNN